MFGKQKKIKKINKKNPTELGQLFKKQLDEAKAQFNQLEFESRSGDGAVSVVVMGTREIKNLFIAPELIGAKQEQLGVLEGLVISVVNDALGMVKAANIELTEAVTKSFNEQLGG